MLSKLDTATIGGRVFALVPVEVIEAFEKWESDRPEFTAVVGRGSGHGETIGQLDVPSGFTAHPANPGRGNYPRKKKTAKRLLDDLKEMPSAPTVKESLPVGPVHTGRARCEPGDGSFRGSILGALKKGPRSSIQLTELLKVKMSEVSPACQQMKEQGRIKTDIDPADGARKWFYVEAAIAAV